MKAYYACLDTGFVKYCPQPLQHLAIGNKASNLDGSVSFYTMEDFETLANQGTAKGKIEEKPAVSGIIYFTVRQFFYSGKFDLRFMRYILERGYEVHFAREDISIPNFEALDEVFPMLYSAQHLLDRDEPRDSWRPVWDWVSENEGKASV